MYKINFIKDFLKNHNCGIMFHHFHRSNKKIIFKGSFSEKDFENLIYNIGPEKIVSPKEFFKNVKDSRDEKKYCITFDDGLKSQFEVALPILNKFKIKAFWFVYTSVFEEYTFDNEVIKYLINKHYPNFKKFVEVLKSKLFELFPKKKYKFNKSHDKHIRFFSEPEREYRFIRDKYLNKYEYTLLIKEVLLKQRDLSLIKKKLFLDEKDLKFLSRRGHYIGLHSHSHPMNITKLNFDQQMEEYKKCKEKINSLTSSNIVCMSHPNNYYNNDTLKALKLLGIKFGFHSQKFEKMNSLLEIPRIDCSYLSNVKIK